MKCLQRSCLILLLIAVILIGPFLIRYHRHNYYMNTWKEAIEEYFFYNLCENGEVTVGEYENFCMQMYLAGNTEEISIREYQNERGLNGETYQYLISWEEIREELRLYGAYVFSSNSEIRLCVNGKIFYGQTSPGGSR